MSKQWSALKDVISANETRKGLFLSLIDAEGNIICANATMQKSLHLQNPRRQSTNFFTLLHPEHAHLFREAIHNSRSSHTPLAAELYLKNGHYHPMKWQVNHLAPVNGNPGNYLCVGYKLVDDDRLARFNHMGQKNHQLIMESLHAGVLFQDKKGELIAANQKAAEIFNVSLERLYQLENIETLWNENWKVTTETGAPVTFSDTPFIKALSTGRMQSEILIVKLRNGEDRWVVFNSQPLFDNSEALPYAVVTNIIDITRETKLSHEAKETESLLHAFLNKTPNLAWVLDEDTNLRFASASFYKYFGLKENEAVNKSIFELVPSSISDALHEHHLQVLETGRPAEIKEKVKWADGNDFVFHINLFPVDGVNGKRMVGGHAVNLADKYAVEKQLRDANDRLLLLTRATSDAIWEWDMQTGYIFRNDALMEMVGYQFEKTKGLSWWLRRIHPEDRNRVTDKIKDATDKGQQSWQEEYRFKCADGDYKHIRDRGFVVYENGLPIKMIGSLQDVSGLKDLEYQLTEEKLERQKEISETIIRVQEKERTRLGHELHDNVNQILSTTKLFVEMLTPTCKEENQIKKKSIEYLMMAIEEIRKLSKELVVPQLNGHGLVDSIQMLVDDIHFSNVMKIKFTHDHENELLAVGKKVTLFRILQEQVKNILKHSGAKHVDIYLHCKDNVTQLIIKDDGAGFNPHHTPRGIGLSNIYERTRFYNGTVDIETAPGKGCTMTISIPFVQ